jgi:hypothetical protein
MTIIGNVIHTRKGESYERTSRREDVGIMKHRSHAVHTYALSSALLCILFIAGCAQRIVAVGSPYERYDHNRTQKIVVTYGEDKTVTRRLIDEVYTPHGTDSFPKAWYQDQPAPEPDSLPVANVVPVFTGIMLPLSSLLLPEGQSDRGDVIDFLAVGPYAKTGVQPAELAGDTKEAEILYGPILAFLSSKEQLTGTRSKVMERLSPYSVDFADQVLDSRYSGSSFQDILAFKYEKFWFILYRLPDRASYSRLVIVTLKVRGQDFPGKKP